MVHGGRQRNHEIITGDSSVCRVRGGAGARTKCLEDGFFRAEMRFRANMRNAHLLK